MDVTVVGAGIGGLTLALELEQAGIACRVLEAVPEIAPIGRASTYCPTRCACSTGSAWPTARRPWARRRGSPSSSTGSGSSSTASQRRFAGYHHPQLSMHRGDVQGQLLAAVRERLGSDAVALGQRVTAVRDRDDHVELTVQDALTGALATEKSMLVIGCDGVRSAIRKQLYPQEGEPLYSGFTMWRGVTPWPAFLSGASMVRAGWLASGKMVIYPVRDAVDDAGNQLVNWVAEVERPRSARRDWNRAGRLEDFIDVFEDWHFDWLDVPALIAGPCAILEYPMVDQDPLPRWTFGVTLLGDAAHPMVPRGSKRLR